MTPGVRPLVAGNWKMNGLTASLARDQGDARGGRRGQGRRRRTRGLPAGDAAGAGRLRRSQGGKVSLGAQDCHAKDSGAFTGDISAPMIKDAGAQYVIVGHSERRAVSRRDRRRGEGQGRSGAESRA